MYFSKLRVVIFLNTSIMFLQKLLFYRLWEFLNNCILMSHQKYWHWNFWGIGHWNPVFPCQIYECWPLGGETCATSSPIFMFTGFHWNFSLYFQPPSKTSLWDISVFIKYMRVFLKILFKFCCHGVFCMYVFISWIQINKKYDFLINYEWWNKTKSD